MGTKRIQMAAMTAALNIRSPILTGKEERGGGNSGEEQRLGRWGSTFGRGGTPSSETSKETKKY